MNLKNAYLLLSAVVLLGACQNNESPEPVNERPTVAIVANIGNAPTVPSRYAQTEGKDDAAFKDKDVIGVFKDTESSSTAVQWNFDGTSWKTENTMYWSNKSDNHTFSAYHPITGTNDTYKSVTMPSLAGQTGTWTEVCTKSFLVATKTTNYGTSGVVSFTGSDCFKHVTSLLKITLNEEGDLKGATINSIEIKGDGIVAPSTYSFAEGKMTFVTGETTLSLATSVELDGTEKTYYFVVNGKDASDYTKVDKTTLTVTVGYTINQTEFTATGTYDALIANGHIQTYSVKLNKNQVVIQGNEIANWTTGEEADIFIGDSTNTETPSEE